MFNRLKKSIKIVSTASVVVLLSACVQTGYNYSTKTFFQMKPGETTLEEANSILGSQPTNVYRALDGSFTAMYSHRTSYWYDAIYHGSELLLAFDTEGKYKNVVGGAGQTPDSKPSSADNGKDKGFLGGLFGGSESTADNSDATAIDGATSTTDGITNSSTELISIGVDAQGNTKTNITETTIKEKVTTVKETEIINNDTANAKSVSKSSAAAIGNTKSLSSNAIGSEPTGAPNTYPVYIKRSGSNVLKRYDMKE